MARDKETRILFIEDVPADVAMVNHELRRGGLAFRCKRVETREGFLRALAEDAPDIILSDHGLPSFSGQDALAVARESCPDVPFVFVTGSSAEPACVEALASATADHVSKGNLSQLVPTIRRALRAAAERSKLKVVKRALQESDERVRVLAEGFNDQAVIMLDSEGRVTTWNACAQQLYGHDAEETVGRYISLLFTHSDAQNGVPAAALKAAAEQGRFALETRQVRKNGEEFRVSVVLAALYSPEGEVVGFTHLTRDRKEQSITVEFPEDGADWGCPIAQLCQDAVFIQSRGRLVFANPPAARLVGAPSADQLLAKSVQEVFLPSSWRNLRRHFRQLLKQGPTQFWRAVVGHEDDGVQAVDGITRCVQTLVRLDLQTVEVEVAAVPVTFRRCPAILFTARPVAVPGQDGGAEVSRTDEGENAVLEASLDAIISMDHNGVVRQWNAAAERLFGYTRSEALGKDLAELIIPPGRRERHRQGLAHYLATGEGWMVGRRMELTACGRHGREFPVEVAITLVRGIEPPMFTGFVRDLSERDRVQAALRQSEALKSVILDTVLDAIISIDHQGLVQEWNRAGERIFGYTRDEAMGQPLDDLIIPEAMRQVYSEGLTDYLLTGVGSLLGRPIELVLRRGDGTEFLADLAITRVPSEDPPRCTAIIRDITERKRAELALRQSEDRFRHLIESVQDYAIYMLDAEGRVVSWNTGAERIEGYTEPEIIGKPLSTFFAPEDIERGVPARLLKHAVEHGRARSEGWRLRKDGSRFWGQGTLTALRDERGRLFGFCKVAHDMTERRKAEEEIRRLNDDLEQRVRERTAELEEANRELEAFSYTVSHDLRSPLRHIVGYVDLVRSETHWLLNDTSRKHLQTVVDAATHLGQLIDALLDFSRMGRAELRQQTIEMGGLIDEARRELHADICERQVDWRIGALPCVQGDPLMLRQVIVNLLSNALKYTRTRDKAIIEVGAVQTPQETQFFIRDNGVGFDAQYGHKLFGVFQRLHPAKDFEGTGIGLASVQRIVQRHGGRVWAESELDRGATFHFALPHDAKPRKEFHAENQMDASG